ncbi:MAG: NAD-dependent succinate-semialdehyde dehydrogenase [Mesorhizobium sp.]|nr:MAG: NAD-dependent succinate-semialdehyde dehydrogenase [Mesorhizobium sp.]
MNAITRIGTFDDADLFRQQALIGGVWREADTKAAVEVTNPATLAVLGSVPDMGSDDTRAAIAAAAEAFKSWKKTTHAERARLLERWHDLIRQHEQDLALLLTLEQGKPIAEASAEIRYGASFVKWFAEEARRIGGSTIPSPTADRRILVLKEAVGVCAIITPWNFPSSMLARKLGPALAAGCTAVVKPASQTPYSGLAWGALAEEVGFPKGVINILTGAAGEIGDEICANPLVKKITFTGSTEVGKILIQKSSVTVKKVSMELGGNAPFLVFDDADIERAVAGAITAKYRNSGQTCVCTNRFLVQAGVYDKFVEKLAAASDGLKVGSGLDDGVQQGPLIDEKAVEKVEELIADATAKGGKVVAGGKRHALGGSFFQPTVIADATPKMRFMKEEIFGPVAPVFKFETEEEAIALANDTEFGLACYFYTGDLGRAFRVMEGLKYGMVGVNEGLITTPEAPFGGVKESGLGKEGGHQGIEDYLDTKYVCIGGLGL